MGAPRFFPMHTDPLLYVARRRQMVEELQQRGISSPSVLRAMGSVPRHLFTATALRHLAYQDRPLPIAAKQTISQPFTVALQTQLLACERGQKVLEIGTGCGYQAAVLSAMGCRVYSIERIKELHLFAQELLDSLEYKATLFYGDGNLGLPQFAPFQGILIACGASSLPQKITDQLAVGGKLVVPLGEQAQELVRLTKTAPGHFKEETFGSCQFVPMLSGTA